MLEKRLQQRTKPGIYLHQAVRVIEVREKRLQGDGREAGRGRLFMNQGSKHFKLKRGIIYLVRNSIRLKKTPELKMNRSALTPEDSFNIGVEEASVRNMIWKPAQLKDRRYGDRKLC